MANNEVLTDLNLETLRISPTLYKNLADCCLIVLDGYLDSYNANAFKEKVMELFANGFYKFIIDCHAVKYISSTGVGCLITLLKELRGESGNLVLLNISDEVYQVIQILGFAKIIKRFSTLEEVEANFGKIESDFSFPAIAACPSCGKKHKVTHAGRYRCTQCKSVFAVMENGDVILQAPA